MQGVPRQPLGERPGGARRMSCCGGLALSLSLLPQLRMAYGHLLDGTCLEGSEGKSALGYESSPPQAGVYRQTGAAPPSGPLSAEGVQGPAAQQVSVPARARRECLWGRAGAAQLASTQFWGVPPVGVYQKALKVMGRGGSERLQGPRLLREASPLRKPPCRGDSRLADRPGAASWDSEAFPMRTRSSNVQIGGRSRKGTSFPAPATLRTAHSNA